MTENKNQNAVSIDELYSQFEELSRWYMIQAYTSKNHGRDNEKPITFE